MWKRFSPPRKAEGPVRNIERIESIFSQGDTANSVFYIQEGQGESHRGVRAGQGSGRRNPANDFFGEGVWPASRAYGDRHGDDGSRRYADRKGCRRGCAARGTRVFGIVHGVSVGRTIRVEADLVDQLFNSSEKRLARLLLLLANFGKEGKPEPIIAKISQETLAEMIGTTSSRVSFFMNKFRKMDHRI